MTSIKDFVAIGINARHVYPSYWHETKNFVKQTAQLFAESPDISDSTPEEVAKIIEITNRYTDAMSIFLNDLYKFTPCTGFNSSEDSIKDLEHIKNLPDIKKFVLEPYDRFIQFVTKIKMKDIYRDIEFDFGNFKITMYKDRVTVLPVDGNTQKNGQYHPYVRSGALCLGDFLSFYKMAMSSMRYHAAFIAVMKCLTNYGGDKELNTAAGPHNPIQLWVGQVCSVCDDSVKSEDIILCEKTKRVICPKCVDLGNCTDDVTREIYHPDLLKKCTKEGCGKNTHTVIRGVCLECRKKSLVE